MSKSDKKLLEKYVYYLDENLGGEKVASALVAAGLQVELHFNHFDRGTADETWLPVIGQRGWILLTQDKGIKKNKMEILSLRANKVRAFIVAAKGLRGDEIGELIVSSIPKIERILKKNHPPIIATIMRGAVVLLQESTPKYPRRA